MSGTTTTTTTTTPTPITTTTAPVTTTAPETTTAPVVTTVPETTTPETTAPPVTTTPDTSTPPPTGTSTPPVTTTVTPPPPPNTFNGLTPQVTILPLTVTQVTVTVTPGNPTIQLLNANNNTTNNFAQVLAGQAAVKPILADAAQFAPSNTPPPVVGTPTTPPPANTAAIAFSVLNTTTQQAFNTPGSAYVGSIPGISTEYINLNTTNLNIAAVTPSVFIKTGAGNDTLRGFFGRDVLDAGDGNNVLVGGLGVDTFLASVNSTGAAESVSDIIKNFQAGDLAIIRGIGPNDFSFASDNLGDSGPELLFNMTPQNGASSAVIGLVGYSTGDFVSGRISASFSTDPKTGTAYMLIQANS